MTVWEMLIELEKMNKDLDVYMDASRPHHRLFTFKSAHEIKTMKAIDTDEEFVLIMGQYEEPVSDN